MAEFKNSGASDLADPSGSFDIGRGVVGIVAKLPHERAINGIGIDRQNVGQCTLSGVAEGFLFVGYRVLRMGRRSAPESCAPTACSS